MKKENVFIKIWRVIYPVGIYFLISNIISFVFIMISAIFMNMDMISSGNSIDIVKFQEELTQVLYKNAMILTTIGALITIPIALLLFRKDKKKENIQYEKVHLGLYGVVAFLAFFACFALNQLLSISRIDELFPGYEKVQESLYSGSIVVEIVGAVIMAPIVEELLFRGLAYKRLLGYVGKIPAMLLSSAFFGLYHGNVVQGIYAFLLGMLIVFIYDKYKSLWAPILAHIIANLTSILSVEVGIFDVFYINSLVYIASVIVSIVVCVFLIKMINDRVLVAPVFNLDHNSEQRNDNTIINS